MTIKFLFNPDLPIIKEGWKGNPMKGRSFLNEKPSQVRLMTFIQSRFHNPQKVERKYDSYQTGFCPNSDFIDSQEDMIVWLGHASFFIRLDGITFLTDPSYYSFPARNRRVPIPCDVDLFKYVDYVLISHMHHDHADTRSLFKIFNGNKKTKALIPLKSKNYIKHFTKNFQEAGWYQKYQTETEIEVYFLPSFHWSRMHIFDSNNSLWGSFMIRGNGKTIYFGGDTAWGNHFKEISELFPSIDYALLPIGAYTPRRVAEFAHISPDEAAKAAEILNAKNFIPMHYGTYPLGQEPIGEPYRKICSLNESNQIKSNLICPDVGEIIFI